jgi:hypothetical protein
MMKPKPVLLLLLLLAVIALSGCLSLSAAELENAICKHPPGAASPQDGGGVSEQYGRDSILFCQGELETQKNVVDEYCNATTDPNAKAHCATMQSVYETTGFNNALNQPAESLIQYNCRWECEGLGCLFGAGTHRVTFTPTNVCSDIEICENSVPNPSTDAYCRERTCDEITCSAGFVCNLPDTVCRKFDCRHYSEDQCPGGPTHCSAATGLCDEKDCTQRGDSRIEINPNRETAFGQIQVKMYVDSAVCEPSRITVKMDNEASNICSLTTHSVSSDGKYWIYSCSINTRNYSNGNHHIYVRTIYGSYYRYIFDPLAIRICNDSDSSPHDCVNDPPVCPAECKTGEFDEGEVTCNQYPAACCKDGKAGSCSASGLKDECRNQNPPLPTGTHCSNGGECQNGACTCPQECELQDATTIACGTALQYTHPPGVSCPPELCTDAGIGLKCPGSRICSQKDGESEYKCWSRDGAVPTVNTLGLQCGSNATALQPLQPATIKGLYCTGVHYPNPTQLCESATATCLSILNTSQFPPKYSFDLKNEPDSGLLYNRWFQAFLDSSDAPANIPVVSIQKIECMDCSNQPSDPNRWLGLSYNPDTSHEGLIPFELENKQLFGTNNYALVTVTDEVNLNKNANAKSNEKFIFKIDAGYSGECVPEDRSFQGKTGSSAKPKIEFNWSWKNDTNAQMKQCNSDNPVGFYCDSTQFLMALLARLETMRGLAENGQTTEAGNLAVFDANLLQDGFSQDFLLDFNYFENNNAFASAPSWFKTEWSKFFGSTPDISFENTTADANPPHPEQINSPGRYRVQLEFAWQAGNWKFFENDSPAATIRVKFTQKIAEPPNQNPLYSLPFDSDIGKNKRPDESAANREGYGIELLGNEQLPLSENNGTYYYAATVPSASNGIQFNKLTAFSSTNAIEQRGKLVTIDLENNSIIFSPVTATPIIMKIDSGNGNTGQAYYSITIGLQAVVLPADQSMVNWTGIGSRNIPDSAHPDPCKGFKGFLGSELFFRRADAKTATDSCLQGNSNANNARGFYWNGVSNQQAVFLKTVFYVPEGMQNTVLKNECIQSNMTWLSPSINTQTNGALNLNYSMNRTPPIKTSTLEQILDALDSGFVCQHASADGKTVSYYWNRSQLEKEVNSAHILGPNQACPNRT